MKDVFYWCQTPTGESRVPTAVSLTLSRCQTPVNLLSVQNDKSQFEAGRRRLTVCLGPLHSGYSDVSHLVETTEINTMFGVDLTVIYNFSMSEKMHPYIRQYEKEDRLHLYNLYSPIVEHSWYFAQRVLINDCIYRYMYQSDYVMVTDIDEIIVPRGNYSTLLQVLDDLPRSHVAEYNVRQVCFPDNYTSNVRLSDPAITKYHIRTLLHTNRTSQTAPHGQRSKYIANPRYIMEGDIHNVTIKLADHNITHEVSESVARVHHYREAMIKHPSARSTESDTIMHAHSENIIQRITKRYLAINDVNYTPGS